MPSVSLDDVRLQVVTAGAGRPLLFIHGFPLDHSMWQHQIARFAATHQVIAPDLRGFGQSEATAGDAGIDRHADDLARLLAALDVSRPATVCGLSMGGCIAWALFRRHRARVAGLILCDCRAATDAPETRAQRYATAERARREGPAFLAEAMIPRLFSRTTIDRQPQTIAATQAVIRDAPPEGVAAGAIALAERPDAVPLLAEIDVPTLILVGAEDVISPPAEMSQIAGKIPQAEFVQVAEAGHMAPLEQPAAANQAIERFLRRHRL